MTALTKFVIEEVEHKLCVNGETLERLLKDPLFEDCPTCTVEEYNEEVAFYSGRVEQLQAVLDSPTIETLAKNPLAISELEETVEMWEDNHHDEYSGIVPTVYCDPIESRNLVNRHEQARKESRAFIRQLKTPLNKAKKLSGE
jgi:hypothetical protein